MRLATNFRYIKIPTEGLERNMPIVRMFGGTETVIIGNA